MNFYGGLVQDTCFWMGCWLYTWAYFSATFTSYKAHQVYLPLIGWSVGLLICGITLAQQLLFYETGNLRASM